MLLKDVGKIERLLVDTIFARSRFWLMDVAEISPAELVAYIAKQGYSGKCREANSTVRVALEEVKAAIRAGEIPSNVLESVTINVPCRRNRFKLVH